MLYLTDGRSGRLLELSLSSAICLELLTAFLWGSWYQVIKRIGDYPIPAFMIWLYLFSNSIIWGAAVLFQEVFVPQGIPAAIAEKPGLALFCFLCGIPFGVGMQIGMVVMKKVGLILSISIMSPIGILSGTVLPMLINGLPEGITPAALILITLVFLGGTLLSQFSGALRDRERRARGDLGARDGTARPDAKTYLLFFINIFLGFGYTLGISYGMESVTNPDALPPMLCCALICLGALAGTLILSPIRLIHARALGRFFHTPPKIVLFSFLSAIGHFGGNVTNMMAAPLLSLSVAWPITTTSNIWAYFWGILYGEFEGSSRRVKTLLAAGVLLYAAGILLLYMALYR